MDLRKLKTLIDLVAESDISELEVTEGESKVRIVKSGAAASHSQVVMMPAAAQGEEHELATKGQDETEAMGALQAPNAGRFGEAE